MLTRNVIKLLLPLTLTWLHCGAVAAIYKPGGGTGSEETAQLALNSVEHIWGVTTVAVGDTAVLHCSFDALFQQLPHGNIDWLKEPAATVLTTTSPDPAGSAGGDDVTAPTVIATGRTMVINDRRYRVYRPHNSALSVLIIRRAGKQDAGVFRCNLAGSTTRQKYLVLNVTDSKIEAQTSPTRTRVKVDHEVTLWCNATGYPVPVVYWTREDRGRRLPDGSYQYWGNGLHIQSASELDTGIYVCHLDNFVQPVVNYKFTLFVDDVPWRLDAYKMRYDSKHWFPSSVPVPVPAAGKSFLLMCETRGTVKPPPTIDWYLDGRPITTGKHFYVINDSTEWRQRYVSSTLVIMRFSSEFSGKYTCLASNGFRVKRQTFRLKDVTSSEPISTIEATNVVTENLPPASTQLMIEQPTHNRLTLQGSADRSQVTAAVQHGDGTGSDVTKKGLSNDVPRGTMVISSSIVRSGDNCNDPALFRRLQAPSSTGFQRVAGVERRQFQPLETKFGRHLQSLRRVELTVQSPMKKFSMIKMAAIVEAAIMARDLAAAGRQFRIINEANNSVLTIHRGMGKGEVKAGAEVQVDKIRADRADLQTWYLDVEGIIRSRVNDFAIVGKGSGDQVHVGPFNGDARHQWIFQGNKIVNRTFCTECLGLKKHLRLKDDADVIASAYEGLPYQHWKIEPV